MKNLAKNAAGTFIYRRRVPRDLLEAVGMRELKRSLDTKDVHTALERFPAAAAWADSVIAGAQARPEAGLDLDRLAGQWLSKKIADYPRDLEPVPAAERSIYADDPPLPWRKRQAAEAAQAVGLALRPGSTRAKAWQAAIDAALADIALAEEALKNGDPLPPQIAARAAAAAAPRLSDAHAAWAAKRAATLTKKTDDEARHALSLFTAKFSDIELSKITKRHVAEFRDDMLATRAIATSKKLCQFIKSFIDAAIADALIDTPNPATGISFAGIKKRGTVKRRAFKTAELMQLFSDDVFTAPRFKAPMPAAKFWLPLLSLYTGARQAELIWITRADVVQRDEIWCINICENEEEGRRVKTDAAVRTVPLHKSLIDLGFLDYVAHFDARLFDVPADAHDNPAGIFSKHINRLIDHVSKDRALTFHSFRHNFLQAAVACEMPRDIRRIVAGHADDHVAETHYNESAGVSMTRIKSAIDAVFYASINIESLAAAAKTAIKKM